MIAMTQSADFEELTPDVILNSAEESLQIPFSSIIIPLPSYINRVYKLTDRQGRPFIFKFYRPGRWSRGALLEEHLFLIDCRRDEIPVVPPVRFPGGGTLQSTAGGIFFAAFPKKRGRSLELNTHDDWRRLGTLMARLHLTGEMRPSRFRLHLHPEETAAHEIRHLLSSGTVSPAAFRDLEHTLYEIEKELTKRWTPAESIRIHGDVHGGNIMTRPGEGLLLIDFDDMMSGPAIQDLWLLLPGYAADCRQELQWLLEGYRVLRHIDRRETGRIELLRAMRMIYFLDWCARQSGDCMFAERNPGWGSDAFWRRETQELRHQLSVIRSQP